MERSLNKVSQALEDFHHSLAKFITACSDMAWEEVTEKEGWSIGATAHHIGRAHYNRIEWITLILDGKPLPTFGFDELNQTNKEQANLASTWKKLAVLDYLNSEFAKVRTICDSLDDDKGSLSAYFPLVDAELTVTQLIENIILNAAREHLESMESTVYG